MNARRIAVYDLDRTVTCRPTYSHFLLRAARRIAPWRLLLAPVAALLMVAHGLGLLGRDRLKAAMWGLLLGRADPRKLDAAVADFAALMLAGNIRPGARAQIEQDRGEGAFLVLATAAQELYARPIAEALGFDAVVATPMAVGEDGRIGPRLAAANVYGAGKLAALEAFMEAEGIAREGVRVTFYSDSSSDHPLFDWCDAPVAVAPSRRLLRMASKEGWRIADWGRPD